MRDVIPHIKSLKASLEKAMEVAEEMDGRFSEVKCLRTNLFIAEDELNKIRRCEQMDDEAPPE